MTVLLYIGVVLLAVAAYKLKKLSKSGALTSILVGFSIALGMGLGGLIILALFFVSSSALSSIFRTNSGAAVEAKGSKRDAMQVLANGGVAAIIALLHAMEPSITYQAAFIASLAAANSDTWASEIGKLSKSRPFHVLTFKRVEAGTSGAVTLLGTLSAVAGSAVIACGALFVHSEAVEWQFPLICGIIVAGFVGNIADTVFGATIQVTYTCEICGESTEKQLHCQEETVHKSGLTWVTNDTVNALCTLMGAVTGAGFSYMIL
ncbi:DUF92 domain-containing protein [Alkalicoccobacillus murimartini]|uniref:Uncharacterized protein (TIGR00297 family) n=1 Tax=Alkalicoccobacillus murimartini TaxID=171685 RepID=A0ABT9YCQ0_9BACI|nr:DUF92 domain-containing protein [Alkalicoccobacillus murimartini]MDQ0205592.1 uncharacterized protein (TIGR00297 family) [Alkalicoccobacillus murimartini]